MLYVCATPQNKARHRQSADDHRVPSYCRSHRAGKKQKLASSSEMPPSMTGSPPKVASPTSAFDAAVNIIIWPRNPAEQADMLSFKAATDARFPPAFSKSDERRLKAMSKEEAEKVRSRIPLCRAGVGSPPALFPSPQSFTLRLLRAIFVPHSSELPYSTRPPRPKGKLRMKRRPRRLSGPGGKKSARRSASAKRRSSERQSRPDCNTTSPVAVGHASTSPRR